MAKPLDSWKDFPKIGLVVDGKKGFYPLRNAVPLWDSGMCDVKSTGEVLMEDFSVRNMSKEENASFQERVDEYSASK